MTMTAERIEHHHGVDIPTADTIVYTDNPRAWAADKMRELADRLASGDLHGVRSEWRQPRDGEPIAFVMVEAFARPVRINGSDKLWAVRLTRTTFRPIAERLKLAPQGV
jgi:hypothetical protein